MKFVHTVTMKKQERKNRMNKDTVCLLKECNSGCKSATNSMEQVMPFIEDKPSLKKLIERYNEKHIAIGDECHELLNACKEDEKDPHAIAKVFSWFSTEMKLMIDNDSKKIAGLMVDGCHMGIKSLSGYLNQYTEASEESRSLTCKLIDMEKEFMDELLTMV